MPLATPPDVYLAGAWRPTALDAGKTAADVARGARKMTARDVQYWRWTVSVDGAAAEVFRLLVAGTAVVGPPGTAVVVPIGRHTPLLRITDTPEVVELVSGTFEVTA